jgi:hypothetical protein
MKTIIRTTMGTRRTPIQVLVRQVEKHFHGSPPPLALINNPRRIKLDLLNNEHKMKVPESAARTAVGEERMGTEKPGSQAEAQPERSMDVQHKKTAEVERKQEVQQVGLVAPHFRIVLVSVIALTVWLLIVDMILVLVLRNPSTEAQNLMDLCGRLATIGFGAIIGLLGAKVT